LTNRAHGFSQNLLAEDVVVLVKDKDQKKLSEMQLYVQRQTETEMVAAKTRLEEVTKVTADKYGD
jgi:hypothetical protein